MATAKKPKANKRTPKNIIEEGKKLLKMSDGVLKDLERDYKNKRITKDEYEEKRRKLNEATKNVIFKLMSFYTAK